MASSVDGLAEIRVAPPGGMYLCDRKDAATAITLFKRGSALDDAGSMVSLVDLIDKGLLMTSNPAQTKLALLHRAAELGHAGAQRGYELELQKANQDRVNQATQQQMDANLRRIRPRHGKVLIPARID